MKLKSLFYQSTLICLFVSISFPNRTYSQDSYWEKIQLAEDLFMLEKFDSSLTNYCATFEKYGVCQLRPWMNAYKISEDKLNGKYSGTLLNYFIKEGDLYYLKKAKSKNKFLDAMVSIPLLDTLKRSPFKESIKRKKITRRQWLKLERLDQRPRKFPNSIFVSNEKLGKLDSINRQKMLVLCEPYDNMVPSKMELFYVGYSEPYWLIFQHYHISTFTDNWNKFDSIFYNSLKCGKYSPRTGQFNLINSVMFDIRKGSVKEYDISTDLAIDWFRISKFNSKGEAESTIGKERFQLINDLRVLIYLEPITDKYLTKKAVFKKHGLNVR